jgi:uncharacterized protein (TIGR04255 family)
MEETTVTSYSQSPVREAIFSVTLQAPLSVERLQEFCTSPWAEQHYGTVETEAASTEHTPSLSYVLSNPERSALLRLTTTQLSFHRIGVYPGWNIASTAFLEAWQELTTITPEAVSQGASVRYINRINLKIPSDNPLNLNDYLNLVPSLPDNFPAPGPFFLQVQTMEPSQKLHAVITEVTEFTDGPPNIEIVLDIRVSHAPGSSGLARIFKSWPHV